MIFAITESKQFRLAIEPKQFIWRISDITDDKKVNVTEPESAGITEPMVYEYDAEEDGFRPAVAWVYGGDGNQAISYGGEDSSGITLAAVSPEVAALRSLRYQENYTTIGRDGKPTGKGGERIGGRRSNPRYRKLVINLPQLIYVTDVHVFCHDQVGNVTKAILRVEAQEQVLRPDWQDVKKAGAWEYYKAPGDGIRASRRRFTSHHKGHKSGDDETVIQRVLIYGY